MIVSILAFSSCDRSKGNPGEVGPIRFRYDSTGQARVYIHTEHCDLPNALRSLADSLETTGTLALLEGVLGEQFTVKIDQVGIELEKRPIVTSHTHSPEKLEELVDRADIVFPGIMATNLEELEKVADLVDFQRPGHPIGGPHEDHCRFWIAIEAPKGIPCSCENGVDICPTCDPCTCEAPIFAPPSRYLDPRD